MTIIESGTAYRPRIVTPRDRNEQIIGAALADFKISRDEFFSKGMRKAPHVAARRQVAKALSDAGLSLSSIARVMQRNHHTVRWYFNPDNVQVRRDRTKRHQQLTRLFKCIDPDARRVVTEYAKAEGVEPETIIAEWVAERARYEAEAKARAA